MISPHIQILYLGFLRDKKSVDDMMSELMYLCIEESLHTNYPHWRQAMELIRKYHTTEV